MIRNIPQFLKGFNCMRARKKTNPQHEQTQPKTPASSFGNEAKSNNVTPEKTEKASTNKPLSPKILRKQFKDNLNYLKLDENNAPILKKCLIEINSLKKNNVTNNLEVHNKLSNIINQINRKGISFCNYMTPAKGQILLSLANVASQLKEQDIEACFTELGFGRNKSVNPTKQKTNTATYRNSPTQNLSATLGTCNISSTSATQNSTSYNSNTGWTTINNMRDGGNKSSINIAAYRNPPTQNLTSNSSSPNTNMESNNNPTTTPEQSMPLAQPLNYATPPHTSSKSTNEPSTRYRQSINLAGTSVTKENDGDEINFFSYIHTSTVLDINGQPTSGEIPSTEYPYRNITLEHENKETQVEINVMDSSMLEISESDLPQDDTKVVVKTKIDNIKTYKQITGKQSYQEINDTTDKSEIIAQCISHVYECTVCTKDIPPAGQFTLTFSNSQSATSFKERFKVQKPQGTTPINHTDTNTAKNDSSYTHLATYPTIPKNIFVDSNGKITILSPDLRLVIDNIRINKNEVEFNVTIPITKIIIYHNIENIDNQAVLTDPCDKYIVESIKNQLRIKINSNLQSNPPVNLTLYLTHERFHLNKNERVYPFKLIFFSDKVVVEQINDILGKLEVTIPECYSAEQETPGQISIGIFHGD